MKALLEFLRSKICAHQWQVIDLMHRRRVVDAKIVGTIYIQRCAKCGVVHSHNVP